MLSTFSNEAEALQRLGDRAYEVGKIDLNIANYLKLAIAAYEAALVVYTPDRFPMAYAMTQNNLGTAYRTLGEVEEKAENCRRAIAAYEAALEIFTEETFPEVYRVVSRNLQLLADNL